MTTSLLALVAWLLPSHDTLALYRYTPVCSFCPPSVVRFHFTVYVLPTLAPLSPCFHSRRPLASKTSITTSISPLFRSCVTMNVVSVVAGLFVALTFVTLGLSPLTTLKSSLATEELLRMSHALNCSV